MSGKVIHVIDRFRGPEDQDKLNDAIQPAEIEETVLLERERVISEAADNVAHLPLSGQSNGKSGPVTAGAEKMSSKDSHTNGLRTAEARAHLAMLLGQKSRDALVAIDAGPESKPASGNDETAEATQSVDPIKEKKRTNRQQEIYRLRKLVADAAKASAA